MSKPLIKNVLIAINGTQSSVHAAMYGIILAKQQKLKLKVVYVVDTATIKFLSNSNFLVSVEKEKYEEDLRNDGKKYLEYIERLAKSKGIIIETEITEGAVCSAILSEAEKFEADLIRLPFRYL